MITKKALADSEPPPSSTTSPALAQQKSPGFKMLAKSFPSCCAPLNCVELCSSTLNACQHPRAACSCVRVCACKPCTGSYPCVQQPDLAPTIRDKATLCASEHVESRRSKRGRAMMSAWSE
eukprot:2567459-Pleurochrysis_carterae.AAC.1